VDIQVTDRGDIAVTLVDMVERYTCHYFFSLLSNNKFERMWREAREHPVVESIAYAQQGLQLEFSHAITIAPACKTTPKVGVK
jgi:hypothetical protein